MWFVAVSIPVLAALAGWVTDRQVASDVSCADGATYASCGASPALAAGVIVVLGLVALGLAVAAHRWLRSPVLGWLVVGAWMVVAIGYIALPSSG